jgi:hypothetical protein
MWIKIFSFLRIFKWTNAIYRIVVEILRDMIPFLVLFFIIISAFNNSFYVLAHNDPSKQFQDQTFLAGIVYGYGEVLGAGSVDQFDQVQQYTPLLWTIWLMNTVVSSIIILNLLVSIMGDTFDRVQ